MFFATQPSLHSAYQLILTCALVASAVVFMVCSVVNGETVTGNIFVMDSLFTFMLLQSCVCALESVCVTLLHLYAEDRRYRRETALHSLGLEAQCKERVLGALLKEARWIFVSAEGEGAEPASDKGGSADCSNKGETGSVEAASDKGEACDEPASDKGEACDRTCGDSDSAASGANTHRIK